MITYRQAALADADIIADFGCLLYSPDNAVDHLKAEAREHLGSGTWAAFIAFDEAAPVGFCEISLRSDYVEGTDGGVVGYIEGVFVIAERRGRNIARTLIKLGEDWSREKGCVEFASDCVLDNTDSLRFHLSVGFKEASRNIHFVKKL